MRESESASNKQFQETIEAIQRDNQAKLRQNDELASELQNVRAELARKALEYQALEKELAEKIPTLVSGKSELENLAVQQQAEISKLKTELYESEKNKTLLELEITNERARLRAAVVTLERSLAREIASGDLEIRQVDNVLIVTMKDSIIFAPDRADLNPRYGSILLRMAEVFKELPEKNIRIEGHTAIGVSSPETLRRFPSSWDLGAARAISVLRFFQNQAGIDGSRLVATSFGEYRPIAPNTTEEEKQANRRVRIVLINRPLYEN